MLLLPHFQVMAENGVVGMKNQFNVKIYEGRAIMLDSFKSNPSVKINRYLLLVGLFIFIPCYAYLVNLFGEMGIDTNEFNTVWLSFDQTTFSDLFQKLDQAGHLQTFLWSYKVNILSMTGFMLTFFALALMVARRVPEDSRLYKTAFLFPILPIIVGVADIIPSLLLLSASGDMLNIAGWKVTSISRGVLLQSSGFVFIIRMDGYCGCHKSLC